MRWWSKKKWALSSQTSKQMGREKKKKETRLAVSLESRRYGRPEHVIYTGTETI
jgi:hypothetical protein